MRLTVAVAVAWFSIAALSVASESEAAIKHYDLNIPRQSLDTALKEFAQQTGLQIARFSDTIDGSAIVGPIAGELTVEDALRSLLSPSGLTYRMVNERTIAVVTFADRPSNSEPSVPASGPPPSLPRESNGPQAPDSGAARRNWFERFRLAQSDQSSKKAVSHEQEGTASRKPGDDSDDRVLAEVVVTGSRIRSPAAAAGSTVLTIRRDDLDKSGYVTVQDVMKQLPQNFGGGVSEDNASDQRAENLALGTAVNLRGLGADSTLVLVNGRRQPAGGSGGAFTDISSIAASAVERIEVLADGASAIYGSDAVGGVVNFILRRDYEGAETKVRLGTLGGDADENMASQLLGKKWSSGNILFGYQYYERDAIAKLDRAYSESDDLRPFGGDDFRSVNSNPGNIFDLTTFQPAFAIPPGQDGRSLDASELIAGAVNLHESSERGDLVPEQRTNSAFFTAFQELTDDLTVLAEGRFAQRDTLLEASGFESFLFVPDSNAFYVDTGSGLPFSIIAYNFLDDLGPRTVVGDTETYVGTLGITRSLGEEWQVELAGSYGQEESTVENRNFINDAALDAALADADPATAFNPYGDGSNTNPATIEAIRRIQRDQAKSELRSANLIVDGSLMDLSGGTAKGAVGLDYRKEGLTASTTLSGLPGFGKDVDRDVGALFAELSLPLLASNDAIPADPRLQISLAGRFEDYSDFGDTFNPKVGVNWSPVQSFSIRGTWGTSFRAPRLVELFESRATGTVALIDIPDPQSPVGFSPVLARTGANAGLDEETATVWTGGVDFAPPSLPDFKLSLTYFNVEYEDRIVPGGPAGDPFTVLFAEEEWASIITRNPSQAEVQALCNSPLFFGSVAACLASQPAAIVDLRVHNLAAVNVDGFDLIADQLLRTTLGEFAFRIDGTYTQTFERAVTDTSPFIGIVDTVGNMPAFRARGYVSWAHRGFGIGASLNYTDGYKDNISVPNRAIDSWTTVDLTLSYRSGEGESWLDGLELVLSAVNLFDEDPPFTNALSGYDTANADPLGRVLSVQISKIW